MTKIKYKVLNSVTVQVHQLSAHNMAWSRFGRNWWHTCTWTSTLIFCFFFSTEIALNLQVANLWWLLFFWGLHTLWHIVWHPSFFFPDLTVLVYLFSACTAGARSGSSHIQLCDLRLNCLYVKQVDILNFHLRVSLVDFEGLLFAQLPSTPGVHLLITNQTKS